eukprot:scaffold28483_cov43-Prasinocladus_malaysianus.AAC.2
MVSSKIRFNHLWPVQGAAILTKPYANFKSKRRQPQHVEAPPRVLPAHPRLDPLAVKEAADANPEVQ